MSAKYSIPDQPERYANAKKENNTRYLDITSVYDGSFLKDKRVAVTGANRGLGLEISKVLAEAGAKLVAIVRKSSPELDALKPEEIVSGIDVMNEECTETIKDKVKGGPVDILINNAGYFYEPEETIETINFKEQLKQIDICAVGPLRVAAAFLHADLLQKGSKIVMITSQGGSIEWRFVQNPKGHDYGHHMSKAAANMASVLLAQELKEKEIAVGILHPGFNKTEMTAKYKEIWEVEGAVDPECGAKRVLYETGKLSMETTGKFINCEDGLEIPF
ncbi:Dehydrogenase/reductase SDR family member 7B [Seminavis robusta]|uniref:Dehydrogenase/reductase SDR family member 7B n=1 Tax=Seminavis robusta TaxID=568900 RepID=A0A9N8DB51_9STRA|nr:Dehydrogenase/reductase SDR family member 7B [Seminavis robusta]|eukprot:Sro61_g035020.1 Dehydrogenase/reductase SDR family member 7B (276) ;mRNA; f:67572-68784